MTTNIRIKRALISVSDKSGLADLAEALAAHSVKIVSTGSTAEFIRGVSIPVRDVSEVTGVGELLDGRVKTLHPKIHAPILADTTSQMHRAQLQQLGVDAFDLVVVNLYPFFEISKNSEAEFSDVIEQIDIGGSALIRAAAKNHTRVVVIVDPSDYIHVINSLERGAPSRLRHQLAIKAYSHTSEYDLHISRWLSERFYKHTLYSSSDSVGDVCDNNLDSNDHFVELRGKKLGDLRYGENSHQKASLYLSCKESVPQLGLASAALLGGKQMSYNNYLDADVASRIVNSFDLPTVSFVKHGNPCGIASNIEVAIACRNAHECDPTSAFGGVVAVNREVTLDVATHLLPIFIEVVVAPGYDPQALQLLLKKKNLRVVELPECASYPQDQLRQISGGFLVQDADKFDHHDTFSSWTQVSGPRVFMDAGADNETLMDLEFAWKSCAFVKSNAILLAKNMASVGIGMGQVNRLDACYLAVNRAGSRSLGAVAASDAFFPFSDGLDVLINSGVKAIVQPGGSVRDNAVIAAAQQAGVTMFFTGKRHFAH